jgi:glycosyltransferase involved in cell wall biosynthesis
MQKDLISSNMWRINMKKDRVNIYWVSKYKDSAMGNAYGYKVHNNNLRKYTEMIADLSEDSKNFFMIMSPEMYTEKFPGINFLFTMFEGTTIPEKYLASINKADYILTPSNWCKDLFCKYYNPDKVFVVNHGVERDFVYKKRKYPINRPFRFLYVGAMNPRKGWDEIAHLWDKFLQNNKDVELYIKTTGAKEEGIFRNKNVIVDTRTFGHDYSVMKKEVIKIYHSAHCFLFPSRGEGFGLTLAEAMRTGLPCIATDYSGQKDFFDKSVGFPIGYKMGKGLVTFIGDKSTEETEIAFPFVDELLNQMMIVMKDYKKALKKGERASQRISSRFTWQIAANKLTDIIREYGQC